MILKEKDFTYEYVNYLNINHMMFCFCKILHRLTNKNYEYLINSRLEQKNCKVTYYKMGLIYEADNMGVRIKSPLWDYRVFDSEYVTLSTYDTNRFDLLFNNKDIGYLDFRLENIKNENLIYLELSTNKKLSQNEVDSIYIPIKKVSLLKILLESWRL